MAMELQLNKRQEFIAHIIPVFRKSTIFANNNTISVVLIFWNNG